MMVSDLVALGCIRNGTGTKDEAVLGDLLVARARPTSVPWACLSRAAGRSNACSSAAKCEALQSFVARSFQSASAYLSNGCRQADRIDLGDDDPSIGAPIEAREVEPPAAVPGIVAGVNIKIPQRWIEIGQVAHPMCDSGF
jgi:hypothetical protein